MKLLYYFLLLVSSVIVAENLDTVFTNEEKVKLREFRDTVKNVAYKNYQLENYYLIHFLRSSGLDVNMAVQKFGKAMKWRKASRIDEITNNTVFQQWMQTKFPALVEGLDKTGSPIIIHQIGKWDIRKIAVAGKIDELTRYIDYTFEIINKKIRSLQNETNGVTQYFHIYDMANYNLKQHACLACIPFFRDLVHHYENYYPQNAKYIILVNTPMLFSEMLQIIRPLMSPHTRDIFNVHGYDKSVWSKELAKYVHHSQLPQTLGGSKILKT